MTDDCYSFPVVSEYPREPSRNGAFSRARSHGADRHNRELRMQHGTPGSQQFEVCTCSHCDRGLVHHFRVGEVAVGQDDKVGFQLLYKTGEFLFREYRNTFWISCSSQFRGIIATCYPRDLRGCKRYHLRIRRVLVDKIEVVKVSSGCSKDYDSLHG